MSSTRHQLLDILLAQEFNRMIPARLPSARQVAHKTGEISTHCHDAGIVFLPDRKPYVVAILSEGPPNLDQRQSAIAEISEVVFNDSPTKTAVSKIVDGLSLSTQHRALLRPGELLPDTRGGVHRLPRFFYEIASWDEAKTTKLTPHFTLAELMTRGLRGGRRCCCAAFRIMFRARFRSSHAMFRNYGIASKRQCSSA